MVDIVNVMVCFIGPSVNAFSVSPYNKVVARGGNFVAANGFEVVVAFCFGEVEESGDFFAVGIVKLFNLRSVVA